MVKIISKERYYLIELYKPNYDTTLHEFTTLEQALECIRETITDTDRTDDYEFTLVKGVELLIQINKTIKVEVKGEI